MTGKLDGPLRHLSVVEIGDGVAVSYAGRCFSALGARVLKIEPAGGVQSRGKDIFDHLNAGKGSAVVNLDGPDARSALLNAVSSADLLLEDSDANSKFYGVDDAALEEANPNLIAVYVSPFGRSGPYAHLASTDLIIQALSGVMAHSGDPDRAPLRLHGPQASYLAGIHSAVAALAAINERRRAAPRFQRIDVVAMLCAANIVVPALTSWAYNRQSAGRRGHGRGAWAIYPCLDGFVSLSVYHTGREWGDFVRMTGIEELRDPKFETVGGRLDAVDELEALVLGWMSDKTKEELLELGRAFRIAIGPANEISEVLRNPQLAYRDFFVKVETPAGETLIPGFPAQFSAADWNFGPVPEVGSPSAADPPTSSVFASLPEGGVGQPLSGVRILDVTTMLAGPYATRLLADLGAEVIKVEGPGRYDLTRGPTGRDPKARVYPAGEPGDEPFNRSSYFNELNRNKLGLSLDLKLPEGASTFFRLTAEADVVIDNFSAGTMHRLGFGYDALKNVNPNVVAASMPSFGSEGPWKDRVAYGSTIEMLSGFGALSGYPDGWPMTSGITYGDPVSGVHGAFAVLAALEQRAEGRGGQCIDVSQLECLVGLLGETVASVARTRTQPPRLGNASSECAPSGVYRCAGADDWLAIEVATESQWAALQTIAPLQQFSGHNTWESRDEARWELDEVLEEWTRSKDARNLMATLQSIGIPAAMVQTTSGFAEDPQVSHLGYLELSEHPAAGAHFIPTVPWQFAGQAGPRIRRAAPVFGQDTASVLRGVAKLTDEEVEALEASGAVRGLEAAGKEAEPA